MDACRASSCCRGAKSALWMEAPVVPSERVTRVAVPVLATVVMAGATAPQAAPGVPPRRWRSWISSPQRRLTRLSIPWTNAPLPHNTTNHNTFNTGSPRTGNFFLFTFITNEFQNLQSSSSQIEVVFPLKKKTKLTV